MLSMDGMEDWQIAHIWWATCFLNRGLLALVTDGSFQNAGRPIQDDSNHVLRFISSVHANGMLLLVLRPDGYQTF